jgi:hypothetical protein
MNGGFFFPPRLYQRHSPVRTTALAATITRDHASQRRLPDQAVK